MLNTALLQAVALLELVMVQDKISNIAKSIAGMIKQRSIQLPADMYDDFYSSLGPFRPCKLLVCNDSNRSTVDSITTILNTYFELVLDSWIYSIGHLEIAAICSTTLCALLHGSLSTTTILTSAVGACISCRDLSNICRPLGRNLVAMATVIVN